jgi:Icc-related predicted phosphoesterase
VIAAGDPKPAADSRRGVRYLVASDLHYALPQFDWIATRATEFDAVVLAGDHLDLGGHAELTAQIVTLRMLFARLADLTTLIANSGNHDLTARRPHGEKAATWLDDLDTRVVTDGMSCDVGADLVSVCAWWEGPTTRAELAQQLDTDASRRPSDGLWIWIYHSPPDASPTSWGGRRHFGDEVLNELTNLHRPDLVLTGHVHDAPFRQDGSWHDRIGDTLVLNAGRQIGPVPAHLIVDTTDRTVEWSSLAGHESISF